MGAFFQKTFSDTAVMLKFNSRYACKAQEQKSDRDLGVAPLAKETFVPIVASSATVTGNTGDK